MTFPEAGIYRLNVGPFYYIGSSTDLLRRKWDHQTRLRAGTHHSVHLQAAFEGAGLFEFVILKVIPRKFDDSVNDHTRRIKLNEQWLLDKHIKDPYCCNVSFDSRFNTNVSEVMKEKWRDPDFKGMMLEKLRVARLKPVSAETRAKMALAKTGARNPKSRACRLMFQGQHVNEVLDFPSASAAAKHFGVSQQAMDQWLRGVLEWPGAGPRKPKPQNRRLTGLFGWYVGDLV